MIEIFALISITKIIGGIAEDKGLKPGTWKLYVVLAWFAAEIIGIMLGFMLLGEDSYFGAIAIGLACAVGSYFIIKSVLSNKPDVFEDEINEIGQHHNQQQ